LGRRVTPEECLDLAFPVLTSVSSGLISDIDGTISNITSEPDAAFVSALAQRILAGLSDRLTLVALVSGRSIAQMRRMVPVEGLALVGNHGLEEWIGTAPRIFEDAVPFLGPLTEAESYLRRHLPNAQYVLENKGPTVAVHYRLARDPDLAREALLDTLACCPATRGLVLKEGRRVIDLFPPILMDKGRAVRRLIQASGVVGAVYLGDDLTDVDAFQELAHLRAAGRYRCLLVAVGSDEAPPEVAGAADCVLGGVDEVISFLELTLARLASRIP
jgi:trehalose 6-phosphate phosphatase